MISATETWFLPSSRYQRGHFLVSTDLLCEFCDKGMLDFFIWKSELLLRTKQWSLRCVPLSADVALCLSRRLSVSISTDQQLNTLFISVNIYIFARLLCVFINYYPVAEVPSDACGKRQSPALIRLKMVLSCFNMSPIYV